MNLLNYYYCARVYVCVCVFVFYNLLTISFPLINYLFIELLTIVFL